MSKCAGGYLFPFIINYLKMCCRLRGWLTSVLQVCRFDRQEGVWTRLFLSVTRSGWPSICWKTHRPVNQNSVVLKVLINRINTFVSPSQSLRSLTPQLSCDPQSPTVSPCLHWRLHRCRSGQDLSSKRFLGDETISCWRWGAAAAPMVQLGKTTGNFRTESRKKESSVSD